MNLVNKSWFRAVVRSALGTLLIALFWVDLNRARDEARPRFFWFLNEEQGEIIPDADNPMPALVHGAGRIYRDGVYRASSRTPWGPLAISITIQDGVWTDFQYLSVPRSPPSRYAASDLAKQALRAQNADIDGVSGATYTSDAFRDDLAQIVSQSKL